MLPNPTPTNREQLIQEALAHGVDLRQPFPFSKDPEEAKAQAAYNLYRSRLNHLEATAHREQGITDAYGDLTQEWYTRLEDLSVLISWALRQVRPGSGSKMLQNTQTPQELWESLSDQAFWEEVHYSGHYTDENEIQLEYRGMLIEIMFNYGGRLPSDDDDDLED